MVLVNVRIVDAPWSCLGIFRGSIAYRTMCVLFLVGYGNYAKRSDRGLFGPILSIWLPWFQKYECCAWQMLSVCHRLSVGVEIG